MLGVKEKNGMFIFDGLTKEQAVKYRKDFFDLMHNRNKVNRPLLQDKDVLDLEIDGMHVLCFEIPQAHASMRPIYIGLDPYSGTYRRDWEGDYLCAADEVSSMFADANQAQSRDAKIIEDFGMDDLDMNSIKQYRVLFDRAQPDHVWSALSTEEFLTKLNVFRIDRKTKRKGLTIAGLLMFGTYSALAEGLPNFFPDYQERSLNGDRWENRICPDGNWESNLFQFYRRILPILQGFLPKPFKLSENLRQGETPANVAVREAFTNALIHADYSVNANLNVYKYPKYIEFSNPGTLLISIRQYYNGGESVCRNKVLQTMFTLIGSAEKAGSGTDKIMHGWEEQNWRRPYIRERNHPNKVELIMDMESLMDDDILQDLRAAHGTIVDKLTHNELVVLSLAHSEEAINHSRVQHVLGIHRADITTLLGKMTSDGLLVPEGYGRGTFYRPSQTKVETSEAKVETLEAKVETSEAKVETSRKKYTREQVVELLKATCQEWQTAETIAKSLNRTITYVRNKLLPRYMDVLEREHDNKHHPEQRYRFRK